MSDYRKLNKIYERNFINVEVFCGHFSHSLAGDTGLRNSGTFLQRRLPPNVPFPCKRFNQRSGAVPNNVHQLRPGDIDVIAAIGDSSTAATGANAIALFESNIDNRGLSFSIGGSSQYISFHSFLSRLSF